MSYTDKGPFTFEEALTNLINSYSQEQYSNTPDYLLARYMYNCMENYNDIVNERDKWHNIKLNEKFTQERIDE